MPLSRTVNVAARSTESECARIMMYYNRFQTKFSVAATNRTWFSRAVPGIYVRRGFSMDSDSLRLAQSNTVNFQESGSKPEVFTLCTYVRRWLDFSIDSNSLRHLYSNGACTSFLLLSFIVVNTKHNGIPACKGMPQRHASSLK